VCHLRSDAYSVELVLLNKPQNYGGTPKLDCYPNIITAHVLADNSKVQAGNIGNIYKLNL